MPTTTGSNGSSTEDESYSAVDRSARRDDRPGPRPAEDERPLAVGGDSAGGNLSTVVFLEEAPEMDEGGCIFDAPRLLARILEDDRVSRQQIEDDDVVALEVCTVFATERGQGRLGEVLLSIE